MKKTRNIKYFLILNRMLVILCTLSIVPGQTIVRAADTSPAPEASSFTPEQIDSLVAPIALYPDELVSQVLVASTYPLEIVQAYQWMQQHPNLKEKELTTAAQQQSWDPSVQALVAFPDVMKRLNQDVTWTTNMGNAFLANQAGVMDEIQKMRTRAQEAGKLKSTEQQKVVNTTDSGRPVVEIEPASPEVIYVPDYDPNWVWGPAPVYYPYPYWYYPPEPPLGLWCWWGAGIFVGTIFVGWDGWDGWGGWGWHPGWYGHSIVVNHRFFEGNHFHEAHFVNDRGRAVWAHDPGHRIGVAYPNRTVAGHFNRSVPAGFPRVTAGQVRFNASGASRVTVGQAREQLNRSASRVQPERIGSRQINTGGTGRNHTVFGGAGAGAAARTYSNRGNASLGHIQSKAGENHGGVGGGGGNRGAVGGDGGNRGGDRGSRGGGGGRR